jgi:single-stranded-DNA-specific exonuclease
VVNPNRRDEPKDSPLRKLAGCSIAFITCLKVRELLIDKGQDCPSIYPLLQFVAIGTICDLVPLIPLNLKLVRHGLKQIPTTKYSGIKAFFTPEERKFPVPSEKLGFHIGPLINSKGRLDHPEMSLNLLISKNQDDAYKYYSHLEFCNKERKFITKEVFEKAEKEVLNSLGSNEHLISLVYSPEWHEGVVGIVASRLVDAFKVPAIVFTDSEEKGIIKGSARSAGDLNLFNLLNDEKDLFLKFGGHKAAAGLSLIKENLPLLRERLNKKLKEIPLIERTLTDHYDLEISAKDITPKLLRDLSLMEPFGNNNEKPIFKMTDSTLESFDLMKEVHVRWNLCSKDGKRRSRGISFNYVGKWGLLHPQEIFNAVKAGDDMSVYFTLGLNRFNGNEYIQLHIQKIELGSI